jgi:predicted phosphodiesterase
MRILIVGDVHGRHRELAGWLQEARERHGIGAAIQVGDFGFSPQEMDALMRQGIRFAVPVHAIDGNHESHRWLNRAVRKGAAQEWGRRCNLFFQPRPSVAVLGNSRAGFMGGALHVDRPQGFSLFGSACNYILRHDRLRAITLFNRERPELIVTHSCPAAIGVGLQGSAAMRHGVAEHIAAAGFDPGPSDDCGESELRHLWAGLDYRPKAWVFGHFHRPHEATIEGTRFVCIDEVIHRSRVIWDTDALALEIDHTGRG